MAWLEADNYWQLREIPLVIVCLRYSPWESESRLLP